MFDIIMVWKAKEQIIRQRGRLIDQIMLTLVDPDVGISCQHLLAPGQTDVGCPYRHYNKDSLETALRSAYSSQGLTSTELPEVMSLVKNGHYHVACTRVFEVTHAAYGIKVGEGVGGFESVTHPNQYAARSIELKKTTLKKDHEMNVD